MPLRCVGLSSFEHALRYTYSYIISLALCTTSSTLTQEELRRQLISSLKLSFCRWRNRGQSCQRSPKGSQSYLVAEPGLTPELPVFFPPYSFVSCPVIVFFQFPGGQKLTNKSNRLVYPAAYLTSSRPKTSQTWHIQKWIPYLPFL